METELGYIVFAVTISFFGLRKPSSTPIDEGFLRFQAGSERSGSGLRTGALSGVSDPFSAKRRSRTQEVLKLPVADKGQFDALIVDVAHPYRRSEQRLDEDFVLRVVAVDFAACVRDRRAPELSGINYRLAYALFHSKLCLSFMRRFR